LESRDGLLHPGVHVHHRLRQERRALAQGEPVALRMVPPRTYELIETPVRLGLELRDLRWCHVPFVLRRVRVSVPPLPGQPEPVAHLLQRSLHLRRARVRRRSLIEITANHEMLQRLAL